MYTRNSVLLSIIIHSFYVIRGEKILETFCSINGSYPFQHVSEKFLSISVDPSDLVELNISESSFLLAEHLAPAYIRIAGHSTKFVRFVDDGKKVDNSLSPQRNSIVVTPTIWLGINEWLKFANLMPIFGISDTETTAGVWNPKSTLPLLDISNKLNVSCYWMLGFDSSNKNEAEYKEDLMIFQNVLNAFPRRKESWKIVGSDISHRSSNEVKSILYDLKNTVAAVTWERSEESPQEREPLSTILQVKETPTSVWMVFPKSSHPVSFSSALNWAEQVGKAAKMGYDVVFRQLTMREFYTDTPVYWFSLLHKKLMGTKVFDVRTFTDHMGSSVYAHCTRKYEDLQGTGCLTVMVVNKNVESYKVKIKLDHKRSDNIMEVQTYILTSLHENSTDVFLNGKLLTLGLLGKDLLQPVFSLTRSKTYRSLKVPPLSIGFFVLPNARIPVCADEGNEADDQSTLSDEVVFRLQSRGSLNGQSAFEKFNSDEIFTAEQNVKVKRSIQEDKTEYRSSIQENKVNLEPLSFSLTSEEMERNLEVRARAKAAQKNIVLTDEELNIIVEAVKQTILKYKSKGEEFGTALENPLILNSGDEVPKLDQESGLYSKGRSIRKRRDINRELLNLRSRLQDQRQHLKHAKDEIVGNAQALKGNLQDRIRKLQNYRAKRDINMELLRLKTEGQSEESRRVVDKTKYKLQEPTRKLWQTSNELLAESEENERSVERVLPKKKISKFATSDQSEDDSDFLQPIKFKKLSLFDKLSKFGSTKSNQNKPTLIYRKNKMDSEEIEDPITTSEEFNNFKGDLPCIYEYFGSDRENSDKITRVGEVQRKLNKAKGKTIKSSADSMEYLRRKRTCIDNVEHPNQDLDKHIADKGIVPFKDEVLDGPKVGTMLSQKEGKLLHNDPSDKVSDLIVNLGGATTIDAVNFVDGTDYFDWKAKPNQTQKRKDSNHVEEVRAKSQDVKENKQKDQVSVTNPEEESLKEISMLKLLQEKLTHKKENIDGLLANQQTLQKNLEESQNKIAKSINQKDSDKVIEKLKELIRSSSEVNSNQNLINIDTKVKNDVTRNNQASPADKVMRRSIIDKENVFGNYKSHTSNIKEWKPSDILSLRKPAEGVVMFSHLISRSKDTNSRRRRSKNDDNLDNNIYLNGIEKGVLEMPEVLKENEDYKLRISQSIVKDNRNDNAVESTTTLVETSTVEEVNLSDSGMDVENKTVALGNVSVVINGMPSNIQQVPTNNEQSALDKFFNVMSNFFSNIGAVLGFHSNDN